MTDSGGPSAVHVAVDGRQYGWEALDWAAAEAAATEQPLHIVHAVESPLLPDVWTSLQDERAAIAGAAGGHILDEAVRRAREVARELRIITRLDADVRPGRAILRDVGKASLIVLGRRRDGHALRSRSGSSVAAYVARRASVPVVIAGLADQAVGPSVGRVAVLADGDTDACDALALAFRAADRRGIGVIVLHAGSTRTAREQLGTAKLGDACRNAFRQVDVVETYLAGPLGPTLAAASKGAALLVLGAWQVRHLHPAKLTLMARTVAEGVRTPIVIVPAVTAA